MSDDWTAADEEAYQAEKAQIEFQQAHDDWARKHGIPLDVCRRSKYVSTGTLNADGMPDGRILKTCLCHSYDRSDEAEREWHGRGDM